jgi:hypothetical protein
MNFYKYFHFYFLNKLTEKNETSVKLYVYFSPQKEVNNSVPKKVLSIEMDLADSRCTVNKK